MSTPFPELVQVVYLPRLVGFALAVLITGWAGVDDLPQQPEKFCFLLFCLLYAFVARIVQQRWFSERRWVCAFMLFDGVLVGLLIYAMAYYLPAALAFVSFLALSTAVIGGLIWVLLTLLTVAVVVTISQLLFPAQAITTSPGLDALIAVSTLCFLIFVAWQVFRTTRAIEFARRHAHSEQLALHRKTQSLARYLGTPMLEVMDTDENRSATQRKWLTVCFTDLCGFTSLMDQLPEHRVTDHLNEYLDVMAVIVAEFNGTLDKFMGDGLMVFFGDPTSKGRHGDALAAVLMALAMQTRLNELAKRWRDQGLPNHLQMRVGLHTGFCTVGSFGARHRLDYTAVGGVVNIASRLEAAAPPGGILVSEDTLNLVRPEIEVGASYPLMLKGIDRPVRCAEVIRYKDDAKPADPKMRAGRIQLLR
jgi:class 3 adenylate cyclase